MINVSVMYPNSADVKFDKEYYCNKHIPLISQLLGDAIKDIQVSFGLVGASIDEAPAFIAMVFMTFDSIEAFQTAFGPHAQRLVNDIPNYTNAQAQIQISEIASK